MRILHTNMLRGWGGQSNRILVEALGAKRNGHEVAVAAPDGAQLGIRARQHGIDVWPGYRFRPPSQPWIFLPDLRRFINDVRRWKPDLIHLHGSQDTWLAVVARTIAPSSFPPLLRTKHNIFEWQTHPLNRWLYGQIDAFVSISGFIDRQLEVFPSIRNRPRTLIHSVPDVEAVSNAAPLPRTALAPRASGKFLWVSTGRLRPEKGFDILLQAHALLCGQRGDAHLLIAGDGSDRATLEQQAAQLHLDADKFQLLGFRSDVPSILRSVDGYVLSSRSEGLGTAILEALAAGLPTVATRVGGIPDSVRHEETGLLVDSESPAALAAAMTRIMDDEALRRRLTANAVRMVREEFTEDMLVSKTMDFYARVAAKGKA